MSCIKVNTPPLPLGEVARSAGGVCNRILNSPELRYNSQCIILCINLKMVDSILGSCPFCERGTRLAEPEGDSDPNGDAWGFVVEWFVDKKR